MVPCGVFSLREGTVFQGMYAGVVAFWTTNLFSKMHMPCYLYRDDLVLYSGVLFTVSNVKKTTYRPPVAYVRFYGL